MVRGLRDWSSRFLTKVVKGHRSFSASKTASQLCLLKLGKCSRMLRPVVSTPLLGNRPNTVDKRTSCSTSIYAKCTMPLLNSKFEDAVYPCRRAPFPKAT